MSSTVQANYKSRLDVTETLSDAGLGDSSVVHNTYSREDILNAATTVPATKVVSFVAALVAGVGGINFSALTGLNGVAETFDGLKIQAIKFQAPAANVGGITIIPDAINGLDLFGATFKIIVLPGQEVLYFLNEVAPNVAATDTELDLTGTGTDVLNVVALAG